MGVAPNGTPGTRGYLSLIAGLKALITNTDNSELLGKSGI